MSDRIFVIFEMQTEDPIAYHRSKDGAERKIKHLYEARTVEILTAEAEANTDPYKGLAVPRQLEYWIEELPLED